MTEFRVWAPKPELVRLDVDGAVHSMRRSDGGWWHATVDTPPDVRYGYLLGDDPTVLPDPRSPRQPEGVHERSQLWDAGSATWTDAGWIGRPVEGAVIYELHVGTFTPAGTFDAAIEKLDYPVDLALSDEAACANIHSDHVATRNESSDRINRHSKHSCCF